MVWMRTKGIPYLVLISLRPKQWIKNSLRFIPLIFSQNVLNIRMLAVSVSAFLVSSLVSGGVYLLNDLFDIEKDKRHPAKARRPLASGALSPAIAKMALVIVFILSIVGVSFINLSFAVIALGYVLIQISYSRFLKEMVLMDVFCIAAGFFLRVMAGAKAIQVPISSWLLICTIFISLFLGLGKRRYEILLIGEEAGNHRKVLNEYNSNLLDQLISIVMAGTAISYSLYALSHETVQKFGTENLWLTIPIVLYGIFRYLYLVYKKTRAAARS